MKEFSYTVGCEHGMHARPCGLLTGTAKKFASECRVSYNGKEADCKRLISVMELGVKYGGTLNFRISGEDENDAANAILKCLSENVG